MDPNLFAQFQQFQQFLQQQAHHPQLGDGSESQAVRQAVISMPSAAQLGGAKPLPFVRFPFFPTAPWMSTNPNVGFQTRFYSTSLSSTADDFTVGSEALRTVQFDIPCRVIAFNGAAYPTDWSSPPQINGVDFIPDEKTMNLLYKFRVEHTSGDKLHTFPRVASTVVGTDQNPGEIGGHGYNVDQGGSLQIGITPLLADIDIDITLVCLELRAPRNFSMG